MRIVTMMCVALAVTAVAAVAGLRTTVSPPAPTELREAVTNHTLSRHGSMQECLDAAKKTIGSYWCVEKTGAETVGICDDVPPPAPTTDTVFDPNAGKYAAEWDGDKYIGPVEPGVEVTKDGVKYTFTDQEPLESHLKEGSLTEYEFTQAAFVPAPYPECWKLAPHPVPPVPAEDRE